MTLGEDERQLANLKGFYLRDRILTPMTGEVPEMLRLAQKTQAVIAITVSFGRKEIYARVAHFNPITGRLTIRDPRRSAQAGDRWVRTLTIKHVKMFTFPEELYDDWEKVGREGR